jgi:hypothetical protein
VPLSHPEKVNRDRYGEDCIDEGQEDIEKHTKGDHKMDYDDDALHECLDSMAKHYERVEDLDGVEDQVKALGKSLDRLHRNAAAHDLDRYRVEEELGSMRQAIRAIYNESRANRKAASRMAKSLERFAKAAESPAPGWVAPLTKAVASFLPASPTKAQAQRMTEWVVKSFGRRGGQAVPYDREKASTLLLEKAITADEHANWKEYGRLPDGVAPGRADDRAQAAIDREMLVGHALAGMNISPLALQHMLRNL